MLTFEDLFVASQAARRQLIEPERLRAVLAQLDAHPERVVLARYLHEHQGLSLEAAKGIHDAAQFFLRKRGEDAYSTYLRQANVVPAHVVEALALEQAQANYTWGLGEKLTQENSLPAAEHGRIQEQTLAALTQEEARVVRQNRESHYAPILGPPRGRDGRTSGRHPITRQVDARTSGRQVQQPDARASARHLAQGSSPAARYPAQGSSPDARASARHPMQGSSPDARASARHLVQGSSDARPQAPGQPPAKLDGADAERTIKLSAGSVPQRVPLSTIRMTPGQVLPLPGASPSAPGPGAPAAGDPFSTMTFNPGEGVSESTEIAPPPKAMGGSSLAYAPGDVIDDAYTVEAELGRGAMGVVYKAKNPDGQDVAIKIVQGPATQEVRGRFEREILVSKRATHEHVIHVFDAGELRGGTSYMVMEVLDGESLQGILLRDGAQDLDRSLTLLEQLFEGLAALHEKKIVHRDLKPENLQVTQKDGADHIKIMDFGVSRFLDQAEADENLFMTMRGQLSGTPQYVAPEAVLEPDVVLTSHDIYASGVILYELVTGSLPFTEARTLRDLLADTVHSRPKPLDEANPERAPYPQPIARLVSKLLEKDPELRPATGAEALELLAEIRRELAEPPPTPKQGITGRFLRSITGLFKRKNPDAS